MGYHNVAAVMTYWPQLGHAPGRLLVHMALMSLDPPGRNGTPACHYWGPVQMQAQAMGISNKASARQLRKLRATLVEAGALELVRPGHKGRPPVWLVITEPPRVPAQMPWLDGTL
jgi:hypothetical protein